MRYCIVGPAYPLRGGIAHHTTLLCRHLAQHHEVHAVTFKRLYPSFLFPGKSQLDPSAILSSSQDCEFEQSAVIDSMNPLTWIRAGELIHAMAPDWALIQWWQPFFGPCLGSIASRARKASRVAFICHNVLPHEKMPLTRALGLRALRNGDAFIVHSEQDRRDLQALLPNLSPQAVRKTVHPEYEIFPVTGMSKEEARARLGVEGRVVLFFGLVRKYKGLMDLVEAMSLVKTPGLTCLVAGEFYDKRAKYEARIGSLGLESSIRIVDGYIPNEEVEPYFAAADVVVLPYRSATQSGIVQIAFRFARPVIATWVGGLPESIDDGRTGLLVPPRDPRALARAIDRYYADSLESRLSAEIRLNGDRFSWDRVVETIEGLG